MFSLTEVVVFFSRAKPVGGNRVKLHFDRCKFILYFTMLSGRLRGNFDVRGEGGLFYCFE